MLDEEEPGKLVLKKVGESLKYFLDGREVQQGSDLELSDGMGGWIHGFFDWTPLSGTPPTLLCASNVAVAESDTATLNAVALGFDAKLRWPA